MTKANGRKIWVYLDDISVEFLSDRIQNMEKRLQNRAFSQSINHPGTYVFLWLGSDNSKGMPTEWKQGFKAVGRVKNIERGERYNDESETEVEIGYVFSEAINRLDILREAPESYSLRTDHRNIHCRKYSTRCIPIYFFDVLHTCFP